MQTKKEKNNFSITLHFYLLLNSQLFCQKANKIKGLIFLKTRDFSREF